MGIHASMKLKNFNELKDILDPKKFEKRLMRHVEKATEANALFAEAEIKKDISAGKYKENAALTKILKGSSKPLVTRGGELFKSIIGKAEAWNVARIGVLKNKVITENGKKKDLMMVAKLVHDGAIIPVSDKMRRLFIFWAFSKKSEYKGLVFPLNTRTKQIVVKGRPFLKSALKKIMKQTYRRKWEQATNKAFAGKNK